MPKPRMIIEKTRSRVEYKSLPAAQEHVQTWRFANDADWAELMKTLSDCYFYRVVGNASLPKCIPNVFKSYGSISPVIWIELMVGSGCFTRGSATKLADRGQGEACASACRIPILESVKANTTVGEVTARIRRNRGQETTLADVMPVDDNESEDKTPSYCSPVQVTKKSEPNNYPLATARRKPIPTFAHQYKAEEETPEELFIESSPKIQYVGTANKQIGGGPTRQRIKNNIFDFKMEDSQGVDHDYTKLSNKRSSAGASSSTTIPSYFELSPPPNKTAATARTFKTNMDKKIHATELARQTIVSSPISAEDRKDPAKLDQIRKNRLKKLNAIRMGSMGIAEEYWDEALCSEDDDLDLDISHIKHEKPDPLEVAKAEEEVKQIAMSAKTKTAGKTPAAPVKEKTDSGKLPDLPVLSEFDDEREVELLEEEFNLNKDQDTQMLPGIPSAVLETQDDESEPATKRQKVENEVIAVESSEDDLKSQLEK